MKNFLIITIIAVVIAGGLSFFGGMKYGESKNSQGGTSGVNSSFGGGQQRMRQGGNFGVGQRSGFGQGGFVNGEIISKDATTMTVKLGDGGSKIVFFSSSTSIMKSAGGSLNDLLLGGQITVMGKTNSDGSVTAETIQVRPAVPGGK